MGTLLWQECRLLRSRPETLFAILLGAFLSLSTVPSNAAVSSPTSIAIRPITIPMAPCVTNNRERVEFRHKIAGDRQGTERLTNGFGSRVCAR